jgi:hypothetical protein
MTFCNLVQQLLKRGCLQAVNNRRKAIQWGDVIAAALAVRVRRLRDPAPCSIVQMNLDDGFRVKVAFLLLSPTTTSPPSSQVFTQVQRPAQ